MVNGNDLKTRMFSGLRAMAPQWVSGGSCAGFPDLVDMRMHSLLYGLWIMDCALHSVDSTGVRT
jgi:hypothetical protein